MGRKKDDDQRITDLLKDVKEFRRDFDQILTAIDNVEDRINKLRDADNYEMLLD